MEQVCWNAYNEPLLFNTSLDLENLLQLHQSTLRRLRRWVTAFA